MHSAARLLLTSLLLLAASSTGAQAPNADEAWSEKFLQEVTEQIWPKAFAAGQGFIKDSRYRTTQDKVNAAVSSGCLVNAGVGFLSGLGGIAALPITWPAGLAGSMSIQLGTVATIAHIRGHDINSTETQAVIMTVLLGDAGTEVLRQAGIQATNTGFSKLVAQVGRRGLAAQITRMVGRNVVRAGTLKAIAQGAAKAVPVLGGLIGAVVDGGLCHKMAHYAQHEWFGPAVLDDDVSTWAPRDVALFLANEDLAEYRDTFEAEEIDGNTMNDLTLADLRSLGLKVGRASALKRALCSGRYRNSHGGKCTA